MKPTRPPASIDRRMARVRTVFLALGLLGCSEGPPYFISGSAKLPSCSESAAADVSGTWFDRGQVTILTDGCRDTQAGEIHMACSLSWAMTQQGNSVDILVDEEYTIRAQLCGSDLHLEGGFWLPVEDPPLGCTYEEDSAAEVGIEAEGATLQLNQDATQLVGTLVVRERCTAEYAVTLDKFQ